jgi:hypothetical protein
MLNVGRWQRSLPSITVLLNSHRERCPMIFDMPHWQRELTRLANSLRKRGSQRRWTRFADASVEKSVMLGFYGIRKMLPGHAFHPPPYLENSPPLSVVAFPRNRSKLSDISWPDVAEAFDLGRPHGQTRDLEYICNQVIHSHFFATWLGPDQGLRGVFCSSDQLRNKEIYRIELDTIVVLFKAAGTSRHRVASPMHFVPDDNRIVM